MPIDRWANRIETVDFPSSRLQSLLFWKRRLAYCTIGYRPTWKLPLFVVILLLALGSATHSWWSPTVGWFLVSDSGMVNPDLILIDNLDTNYLLFEKARDLKLGGATALVLVPVVAGGNHPDEPNVVSQEITRVLLRLAQLESAEMIPITQEEPITLNTARQVGNYLLDTGVKKVLILTSGFKSKRIHLIFRKVLSEVGIETCCLPVWGTHRPENWTATWHGIQEVILQHVKLAYYRLWVLQ